MTNNNESQQHARLWWAIGLIVTIVITCFAFSVNGSLATFDLERKVSRLELEIKERLVRIETKIDRLGN